MITFDLEDAHLSYRDPIRDILVRLAKKYPQAPLRTVKLYRGPAADRSLANTTGTTIALNRHWFGQDPEVLQRAALECRDIDLGRQRIAWHGEMTEQPEQLLTHEFGHALSGAVPGWRRFAVEHRNAGLRDPASAPSGYALVDPEEFWAEAFCATELGKARPALAREVRSLLGKL